MSTSPQIHGGPGEETAVAASDGTIVPLEWFPAGVPRFALLMLPALGIQCRLYRPLANALAAGNCATLLMEQRGHGRSPIRASRGVRYGLAEYIDHDIPAALDSLEDRLPPGTPVILGGHSLGGHLATIYAGIEPCRLAGVLHVATGSPYYRDFAGAPSRLIRLLCALIPLFRFFPGYFPGNRLGFAGRESLALMKDWRDWALTGRFDFGDRDNVHDAAARFAGPVLSISLQDDQFSSETAEIRATSPLVNARLCRVRLGRDEQGEFIGHFGWARNPSGVAARALRWMAECIAPAQGDRIQR